eukprot:scaffold3544_cov373-Prasinococcus_capsulatus_cf.AAC.4
MLLLCRPPHTARRAYPRSRRAEQELGNCRVASRNSLSMLALIREHPLADAACRSLRTEAPRAVTVRSFEQDGFSMAMLRGSSRPIKCTTDQNNATQQYGRGHTHDKAFGKCARAVPGGHTYEGPRSWRPRATPTWQLVATGRRLRRAGRHGSHDNRASPTLTSPDDRLAPPRPSGVGVRDGRRAPFQV